MKQSSQRESWYFDEYIYELCHQQWCTLTSRLRLQHWQGPEPELRVLFSSLGDGPSGWVLGSFTDILYGAVLGQKWGDSPIQWGNPALAGL